MVTCVENNLDLHEEVRLTVNDMFGWGAGGGTIPTNRRKLAEESVKSSEYNLLQVFLVFH